MQGPEENINPLRSQEFFFWLCAYAAVLVFLNTNSLFGSEALVAEAAREICISREWTQARINFQPFPGLHPLNVLSVALLYLGVGISEFSTRLLAAATTLILFSGVRRLAVLLFDRRTALVAGWLTLGAYSVLYLGRSAGDCIPACAAVVWTVAWYLGTPRPMSFARALIFYLLLFFAGVLYGNWCLLPLGFLVPWWSAERSFRGALSPKCIAALFIVEGFGFLWWIKSGGDALLATWQVEPAAAGRAFTAALAALGESYLDKGLKFLYQSPLDAVRVLLPWPLLALATGIAAARGFKTATQADKMLGMGIATMFATTLALPEYQWRLMMPLVPFAMLLIAHTLTDRAESDRWLSGAVFATRSALLLMAALGAVAPVALPVLPELLKFELPLVVIPTCTVTGIAVLAIMLLDNYPGVPLCRLSGLPARINSSILGGTLITIGMISLIVPAFRDMREEGRFLKKVREEVADLPPDAVAFIGDAKHAAALLFYTRMRSPITLIRVGDREGFSQLVERRRGRRIAVIARNRDGAGQELDFLRRCAAENKLKPGVSKLNLEEKPTPLGELDRRNAFFRIDVPGPGTPKTETTTSRGN